MASDFGELYRSVQQVYKNAIRWRLFATARWTAASDLGVVHLLYEALWDLPVWYSLCTHSLSELFRSDFGELYRSVRRVYENTFRCRFFATAWWTAVSGLGVVHLVYKALRDLPVWYKAFGRCVRLGGAVQIRTAGAGKCSSLQIVRHGPMKCHERSRSRTPGVQGATGSPSLV